MVYGTSHIPVLLYYIHKTVKIIFVCLTTAALVIFNWRLTNVLTN